MEEYLKRVDLAKAKAREAVVILQELRETAPTLAISMKLKDMEVWVSEEIIRRSFID